MPGVSRPASGQPRQNATNSTDRAVAGVPGLEPRLTGPEPVGLPITPYPTGPGLPARSRLCSVAETATGPQSGTENRSSYRPARSVPGESGASLRGVRQRESLRQPAQRPVLPKQCDRIEQRRRHPAAGHRDPHRDERGLRLEAQFVKQRRPQGILGSIIGSIIVLLISRIFGGKRRRFRRA